MLILIYPGSIITIPSLGLSPSLPFPSLPLLPLAPLAVWPSFTAFSCPPKGWSPATHPESPLPCATLQTHDPSGIPLSATTPYAACPRRFQFHLSIRDSHFIVNLPPLRIHNSLPYSHGCCHRYDCFLEYISGCPAIIHCSRVSSHDRPGNSIHGGLLGSYMPRVSLFTCHSICRLVVLSCPTPVSCRDASNLVPSLNPTYNPSHHLHRPISTSSTLHPTFPVLPYFGR